MAQLTNQTASHAAALLVGELAEVKRTRNGRLGIDWLSRRQTPRWKMMALDGEWYDRERLKRYLASRVTTRAGPGVPKSRRKLTDKELATLWNSNPYSLLKNQK